MSNTVITPNPVTSPASSKGKRKWPAFMQSYIFLALITIVVGDTLARFAYPWWPDQKFCSPYRSYIWWAFKDWNSESRSAKIDYVLLGSSLMWTAVHSADATRYGVAQHATSHHHSFYLQELLNNPKEHTHRKQAFSFAIAGQMASDAFFIARSILPSSSSPAAIIYGIAPRDLMDNTLASPTSTETYQFTKRLFDHSQRKAWRMGWQEVLQQSLFLYTHRLDVVWLQHRLTHRALNLVGFRDLDNVYVPFALRRFAMRDLPEDIGPNEVPIQPYNPAEAYIDNSAEYRKRYARLDNRIYSEQKSFLTSLARLCQQNHVSFYLINMPITQNNMKLMPPGFYSTYLADLQQVCSESRAIFIDLNDANHFPQALFSDSVHLNGMGAKLFFERLADSIRSL